MPAERLPQTELVPRMALRSPMHGFLEVDVTRARQLLSDRRLAGEGRSFTAFVIACVARAVDHQRQVQAFRKGRRLVVFDQVDVSTMVEIDAHGAPVPIPYVIRDAAGKTVDEIHREIRAVQQDPAPHLHRIRRQVGLLGWIPRPVRWLMWGGLARSPALWKRFGGTVVVSSVGMFGSGRAWGLGVACYPVSVIVGGISSPTQGRDDGPERQHLHLTVSLDHEAVDGGPAARFMADLRENLEQAHGLEPTSVSPPVTAPSATPA